MISKIFQSSKGERVANQRTICEVHRELFDKCIIEFHDKPEALKEVVRLLEEAFVMGVKITDKLVKAKIEEPYDETDVDENKHNRQVRVNLLKLLEHNEEFLKKYA